MAASDRLAPVGTGCRKLRRRSKEASVGGFSLGRMEPVGIEGLRIVPANEASWDDLQAILTGTAGRCQCQRQRLGDHDWWYMPAGRARCDPA